MSRAGIVNILMARDGLSRKDAMDKIEYCSRRLYEEAVPIGSSDLADKIIAEELGLEPDYLIDLL